MNPQCPTYIIAVLSGRLCPSSSLLHRLIHPTNIDFVISHLCLLPPTQISAINNHAMKPHCHLQFLISLFYIVFVHIVHAQVPTYLPYPHSRPRPLTCRPCPPTVAAAAAAPPARGRHPQPRAARADRPAAAHLPHRRQPLAASEIASFFKSRSPIKIDRAAMSQLSRLRETWFHHSQQPLLQVGSLRNSTTFFFIKIRNKKSSLKPQRVPNIYPK